MPPSESGELNRMEGWGRRRRHAGSVETCSVRFLAVASPMTDSSFNSEYRALSGWRFGVVDCNVLPFLSDADPI